MISVLIVILHLEWQFLGKLVPGVGCENSMIWLGFSLCCDWFSFLGCRCWADVVWWARVGAPVLHEAGSNRFPSVLMQGGPVSVVRL
jgi:hypothetical protein